MIILQVLIGLLLLTLLVVIHELGHGVVARRNGVKVEEFGVGFPPKAWGKKITHSVLGKNVLFTLNWLPLGGFVRLQGEYDAAHKKGDFGAATYWVKTKIILAGVVMNWLTAWVLFSIVLLFGMPKLIPQQYTPSYDATITTSPVQIVSVTDNSAASRAGLQSNDQLVRIDGEKISTIEDVKVVTAARQGKLVAIEYTREGTTRSTEAQLGEGTNGPILGVASSGGRQEIRTTWTAPFVGFVTTVQLSWFAFTSTLQVVGDAFTGALQSLSFSENDRAAGSQKLNYVSENVAGPVGILGVIFPSAQEAGIEALVLLTAIISLSLAIMNILPIPALDGGRWYLITWFKLRKKNLTKETEEKFQAVGFYVLMGLVVLITIADIGKF